jgi:hypothetical protein
MLFIRLIILTAFLANSWRMPEAQAQDFILPAPGNMVHLSPGFNPPVLKGIKVHPENPLQFEFILDTGDVDANTDQLKRESAKLIKYFLASLTTPEKDLWVNLSPYEKDRIIPKAFGLTEMGRDLLAEDYMLKQITASLIYPGDAVGKKFWKRIYQETAREYGTTDIPVNTFNKVWIIPQKAVVYENVKSGTAYVVESRLEVMLEGDYLSLRKHEGISRGAESKASSQLGSRIVREIVIPELAREVNEDRNFSPLRQVYSSLILAAWYKKKVRDSILSMVYSDKNKVAGVNVDDPREKERIYQRYLAAFKKGVFNYIKEDLDPGTQEAVPRKYFSGGMNMAMSTNLKAADKLIVTHDAAMLNVTRILKLVIIGATLVLAPPAKGQEATPPAQAQEFPPSFLPLDNILRDFNSTPPAPPSTSSYILELIKELRAGKSESIASISSVLDTAADVSPDIFKEFEGVLNDESLPYEYRESFAAEVFFKIIEKRPGLIGKGSARRAYLERLLNSRIEGVYMGAGDELKKDYSDLYKNGKLPLAKIQTMLKGNWAHQRIAADMLSRIYADMIDKGQMKITDLIPMIDQGGINSALAAKTFGDIFTGWRVEFIKGKEKDITSVLQALLAMLKTHPVPTYVSHPKQKDNMDISSSAEEALGALYNLISSGGDAWAGQVYSGVKEWVDKNGYNGSAFDIFANFVDHHADFFQPDPISFFEAMAANPKYRGEGLNRLLVNLYSDAIARKELSLTRLRQKYNGKPGLQPAIVQAIAYRLKEYGAGLLDYQHALSVQGLLDDNDHSIWDELAALIKSTGGTTALIDSMNNKNLSEEAYDALLRAIAEDVLNSQGQEDGRAIEILTQAVKKEGLSKKANEVLVQVIKMKPSLFDPQLVTVVSDIPDYLLQHGFPFWQVYLNEYFQQRLPKKPGEDGRQDILRYDIASSVYRLSKAGGLELTPKNIADAVNLVMILRERSGGINPFSSERKIINFLHMEGRFDQNRLVKMELDSGAAIANISSIKGSQRNRSGISQIARSYGPLTVFFSGHGNKVQQWQAFGQPGVEISYNINDPNAISYELLGKALMQRGQLDQVIIFLDSCYSTDYGNNLIGYLRKKGAQSFPRIVAWADFGRLAYGSLFLMDFEKAKQVSLAVLLSPSKSTLEWENPTVTVPVPDDLKAQFPQFFPQSELQIPLLLRGSSYRSAPVPSAVQISFNGWKGPVWNRKTPADSAQSANKGGIDLNPANMNLLTQNAGGSINFHLDPLILQRLQNAPGFVPVIVNIRPMRDLRVFLGLSQH